MKDGVVFIKGKREKISININMNTLTPIFEFMAENQVNNFYELQEIFLRHNIDLKITQSDYFYSNSKLLGVIDEGMISDTVLLFPEYYILYSNKILKIDYADTEHIKRNKFYITEFEELNLNSASKT